MQPTLTIGFLADHPARIAELVRWFEAEWPDWYGPGGRGDAELDLRSFRSRAALPIGLIGLLDDELVGIAALKRDSIPARAELSPWAAAGLVRPDRRGRGFGAALVRAIENLARDLGHPTIFCATATSVSLLERADWSFVETLMHDGERLSIYRKSLEE